MTDVKSGANPLFLREDSLHEAMEMLFFAYREFTAGADAILSDLGLGRAHHRVIYFVARNPDINVSELLNILGITKQSLSRVLATLIEKGYVTQSQGTHDRRQRLLRLTQNGIHLEEHLSDRQRKKMAGAFRGAGPGAVEGFRKVLLEIMDEGDRQNLSTGRAAVSQAAGGRG